MRNVEWKKLQERLPYHQRAVAIIHTAEEFEELVESFIDVKPDRDLPVNELAEALGQDDGIGTREQK